MDRLEQSIWEKVKCQLPELIRYAKEHKFTDGITKLSMPIMIDGVIDEILYDKKRDKFVSIRYSVGKGACYRGFMDYYKDDESGYFDDVECRTLDISNFPQ